MSSETFPKEIRAVSANDEHNDPTTWLYYIDGIQGNIMYYKSPAGGVEDSDADPYQKLSVFINGQHVKASIKNPTLGVLTFQENGGTGTRLYYRNPENELEEICWTPKEHNNKWYKGELKPGRLNPDSSITAVYASEQLKVICTLERRNDPVIFYQKHGKWVERWLSA